MSCLWLVVIADPLSEVDLPEALEAYLAALLDPAITQLRVARVQRGGLLARKVMAELPPMRHRDMGRAKS